MANRKKATKSLPAEPKPKYSVPALDKALDVLEALAFSHVPLTLTGLSHALRRSSSSLFRTVDAMEKRGYVSRDPLSGAYRLTLKLYELAHIHSPVDHLLRAARLPMRELAESVSETCSLAILNGGQLMVIAEELSSERVRLSVEIGSRVPRLRTVSGRLLIAFLDEAERQALVAADEDYLAWDDLERKRFLRSLEKTRQSGCLMAPSDFRVGPDLGVLVGNPASGIIASLAIPVLAGGKNKGRETELFAPLARCAHRITLALGLTPIPQIKSLFETK